MSGFRVGVCGLAALTAVAQAANPFALPGSPTLGAPVSYGAIPIGIDAAGNAWYSPSSCTTPSGTPYSTAFSQPKPGAVDLARNVGIVADYNLGYAPTRIQFYKQTCDGQPIQTLGVATFTGGSDENSLSGGSYIDAAGHYCQWFVEGARCMTVTATPVVTPSISFSAFDPIIANAEQKFPQLPPNLTPGHWSVSDQVVLSDGRMFALISFSWIYGAGTPSVATYSVHTVVEISAAGAVTVRVKPWFVVDRQGIGGFQQERSLLSGVRYLRWDADLDAVVGYPLIDINYGTAFNHQFGTELITSGVGMAVIPLSSPGAGLVDLTATLDRIDNSQEDYIVHDLVPSANGTLRVVTSKYVGPPNVKLRVLGFDRTTLDADRDGKSAAAESAGGTSDYVANKEAGGGVATSRYAYSSLLVERIPLRTMTRQSIEVPWVCGQGVCYDAAGREKVRGPTDMYPTRDGRAVFFDDGTTIGRNDVATGTMTPFISHDAAIAASGGNPDLLMTKNLPLIPIDYDRVIAGPEMERLVVITAGAVNELWDPRTAFCDAQRGTCAPAVTGLAAAPEMIQRTRVIGYDPVQQRALMSVRVTDDEMTVSVGLDASAFILGRLDTALEYVYDYSVVGFFKQYHAGWTPKILAHLGTTGFLATYAITTATPERFVSAALDQQTEYPLGYIPGPFGAGWGTSAFTINSRAEEIDDNLFESVLYERAIQPGDVVSWSDDTVTPAFGKSGARGGYFPFFSTPLLDENTKPTGIGLAADGRICTTFSPGGGVIELVEPDAGRIPVKSRLVEQAIGAVACLYDAQDHLVVLADGPPRLLTYSGATPVVTPLNGITKPRRFVRSETGEYRIASSEDVMTCVATDGTITRSTIRAAGLGWALDGKLLVLEGGTGALRAIPDAEACTSSGTELGVSMTQVLDDWSEFPGCLAEVQTADVVQRPDGRIVMQLGDAVANGDCLGDAPLVPHTWNPRTGYIGKLTPNRHTRGGGLAIVPGGTWCDPWEDVLPPGEALCDLDVGGDDMPGDDDAGGDGTGGCCDARASRGSALGALLLGLSTLLAIARSRRPARQSQLGSRRA